MKKKNICGIVVWAIMTALGMTACEKEPPAPGTQDTIEFETMHALVLNEGPQGNNASLSYLDLGNGTLVNDWFAAANGRGLGNVAQDLVIYGSKAYVTVWASGSLEVIDTATGTATHIDLGNRGPRYIAAEGGKLYITCYNPHSVIRVDTNTLEIEATCTLGGFNPEGIAVATGKLFVVSDNISDQSGNYSYDDKLYVINISTFEVDTTIVVGSNPQKVMPVGSQYLVVNCWGEWNMNTGATVGEGCAIVNVQTLEVRQVGNLLTNMAVHGDMVYGYASTYDASWQMTTTFMKIDPQTLVKTTILDDCGINNPYAIAVHPTSGNVYVATDGNYISNGDLYCFAPDGTRRWKREVGMLPSKIVFF